MESLQQMALAAGLAWASGIRLYAAVFIAGLLGRFDWVTLPAGLAMLEHDWVLVASGVMMVGEFVADKVPAFDSVWDALHTFIRIPAGILLSWGVFSGASPEQQFAAALVGGAITSGTHLAKAGTRALINTSPEPFSNWGASLTEDITLVGGLYLIWQHPLIFLALLALFLAAVAWLLPKLWRALRSLVRRIAGASQRNPAQRNPA